MIIFDFTAYHFDLVTCNLFAEEALFFQNIDRRASFPDTLHNTAKPCLLHTIAGLTVA